MRHELWNKLRPLIEPKNRRAAARVVIRIMERKDDKGPLTADAGYWTPNPVKICAKDGTGLTRYEPCCECRRASSWKGWVSRAPIGRDIVSVCNEHMPLVDEPWLIEESA